MARTLFLFLIFSLHAQKICLNMIVKNEADCIEECLLSAKPLIDYWVIVDTGSTDDTKERIKECLYDIPGELHSRPWVNFGHNRTEALELAKPKADYILFIDADEVFKTPRNFTFPPLTKDYYTISLKESSGIEVLRPALINARLGWFWEGVVHETLRCPNLKTWELLADIYTLYNVNLGARTKDPNKFLNDARLLETAPPTSRNLYYLAISYSHANLIPEAINAYQRRIDTQSNDPEETFHAIYNMGLLQISTSDVAIATFFKAHAYRPTRAEPLFQIAALYRQTNQYELAFQTISKALPIPFPPDTCVDKAVYDYQIQVEYTYCAFFAGKYSEGIAATYKLLANPHVPHHMKPQLISNLSIAKNLLSQQISLH